MQTLLVTARVADPVQINVALPFAETYRSASGRSEFGGGVSDMSLSIRWDALRARGSRLGVAPLVSLTLPSGTPIEQAKNPLATDATGVGSAELGAGLALEKIFDHTLVAFTATALFHGARTVYGVHSQLGPDISGTFAVSHTFVSGITFGGSLMYMQSFDSSVDDRTVPDSARALEQVALVSAFPLRAAHSRVLASVFFVPPIPGVAQNENGVVGASLTFIYGFSNAHATCAHGICASE